MDAKKRQYKKGLAEILHLISGHLLVQGTHGLA
jgi:hypothetical protein